MKRILIFMLFIASLSFAQTTVDTLQVSASDSIDIRAMVQKQIEDARNKRTVVIEPVKQPEEKIVVAVTKETPVTANSNFFISFFVKLPLHYQLFSLLSLVIIGFVSIKRVFMGISKSSMKKLKVKIGMMREEKVGGSKINPKLQKIRKVLKENLEIFKQNEKHLAKTARELNVSQGELLLAARLKFYEMKKL